MCIPHPFRELPDGARQQEKMHYITSERRTKIPRRVDCAGCARYSACKCRETGIRVVPQRYIMPLSLEKEAKAFDFIEHGGISNGIQKYDHYP